MTPAAARVGSAAAARRTGRFDPDLPGDLRATLDPAEIVDLLRVRGQMTQAAIAIATGVSERTVRSWEQGADPRQAATDRLHLLAEVVAALTETLTPRGANQWLRARAAWLDGARPLERLLDNPTTVLDHARTTAEPRHG